MTHSHIQPARFQSQNVRRKTYLGRPMLYGHSTDQEILYAITYAGQFCYAWRRHDWPVDVEHVCSWVTPTDIGFSSGGNTELLHRLKKMAEDGVIDMRYHGKRPRFRGKPQASAETQVRQFAASLHPEG
jgi:hypothetical protein